MPRFDKWLGPLGPDAPVSRAARQALEVRLAAVEHFFGRAAKQPKSGRADAEAIHQLRIWTRRAAAALRLFRDLLPTRQARWLKKKLQQVRRTAGMARDCDVLLARLPTHSSQSLASLTHQVQARRRAALRDLARLHRRLIAGRRLPRRRHKLLAKADRDWADKKLAKAPFGPWYRAQIRPLTDEFFCLAAADPATSATLHQLRIAGKRLRYALELAAGSIPSATRNKLYDGLTDLQDRLGEVCDHLAGVDRLKQWIAETDDRGVRRHLRAALGKEQQELVERRKRFLRWWTARRRAALKRQWIEALRRN
jgi:CHAD domain-containing protein